jgi:putative glutamine amidotransferase
MAELSSLPRIGITAGRIKKGTAYAYELGEAYLQAIHHAGGMPIILPAGFPEPLLESLLSQCDALILSGGGDIDPRTFQPTTDSRAHSIDQQRDSGECFLARQAFQNAMPILGICRGIQLLNVAFGGSLYIDLLEDLPGSDKHAFYPNLPRDAYRHTIQIDPENLFYELMAKETIKVNSLHHQGIKELGEGLMAVAYAEDGSIETIVAESHPWCIGVQWHPECLPKDKDAQKLFSELINAARNFQAAK